MRIELTEVRLLKPNKKKIGSFSICTICVLLSLLKNCLNCLGLICLAMISFLTIISPPILLLLVVSLL